MATVMPRTVCPVVEVSWNGSGLYDQPYDDVTADVPGDPGLTVTLGKDGARTLDPPHVSALDLELLNHTGKYSQERADSPVYQLVLPGRPVRVTVEHGTTDLYRGTDEYRADDPYRGVARYQIADGAIDDISQATGYGSQRVTLSALGVEQLLVAASVTVGVMTSPRVDQCVTAILDAVGWPSSKRSIALADTTLTYWWCDDRAPWPALMELLLSEGPGAMYVDGSGIFHFENRNFRNTAGRSTTSQAVFFDTGHDDTSDAYRTDDVYRADDLYRGTTSGLYFTALSYDPGYRNLRNRATYNLNTRVAGSAGTVIWTYGASVTLASGQSVTLIAKPNDPFTAAITPTTGGGDFTVSGAGSVAASLSASSGLVAFITLTASGGSATVSGLRLRATPLTVVGQTTVQNVVDASLSIAKFSPIPGQAIPRVFEVDGWPEIAAPFAQAVCDAWVTRYMVQRPAVEITVENADAAHVREILDRTVSDRITLTERNTGISADVWINSKTLTIEGAGGRRLVAVFGCEKIDEVAGTAIWSGPDIPANRWNSAIWGV